MKIKFFFDYLSPYAYLAWHQLPQLTHEIPQLEIDYIPTLFAGLLNHWGQKGPAEIAPKRDYVFTHCLRIATRNNIPFTLPKFHPFNPITCLRLSLREVSGDQQLKMIAAMWQAGWVEGIDLANVDSLQKVLEKNGFKKDLLEKTNDPVIKQALKNNTEYAIQCGVFGVPTFYTEDGTLFWGLDSLPDLQDHLQVKNVIDPKKLRAIIQRERGAERIK